MENLFFKAQASTPEVILNAKTGLVSFGGKSRPEDPDLFFMPITDWIIDYIKNPAKKTTLVFKFSYFNTSTSKKLIEILLLFDVLFISGKEIEINWHYKVQDEDMLEDGEMLNELTEAPVNFIGY
jgi:pyruvate/2-oxoacid:ferredoxin oxidoreductase alpha subunit